MNHTMKEIDFRSDTVTWPTPAMREAMARAQVGDDVYDEDPTVHELEATAANLLGHESALFVSSGTQGNLLALLSHTRRGDEVIMGQDSHTAMWEAGGAGVLGGLVYCQLPTDNMGRMAIAQVEASIKMDDPHLPRTTLISTENSSGGNNGAAIPPDYFAALRQVADKHGLRLHLDGARLFNATTALGIEPTAITQYVDSVSICLSKGLCAPVGSVLVGPRPCIAQARRYRKMVGGGMRQAGVLAAAGLIALREMRLRLGEDHRRAKLLAEGLAQVPGVVVDVTAVQTNMVFFELAPDIPITADELVQRLWQEHHVRIGGYYGRRLRAVTHYWLNDEHVQQLTAGVQAILTASHN
jgi:threonine aldolase